MSELAEKYRRVKEQGGIVDLSDRVKLRLTGADRVRFLNGQVTANVQKLAPGVARAACVTTAKGRLCAEVFLHATADALWLDADAALRDALPPRIERYIISDDVEQTDVSDELRLLHLLGAASERPDVREGAAVVSRADRFGAAGLDLWFEPARFDELWQGLTTTFPIVDEGLAESLRIEAGIPRWGRELDENTLPPEAGLERTHIDYDKGCYIGQEVISRLKSVGHVNRRLAGFVATDDGELRAGLRIFGGADDAAELGVLTSAAWSFALEKPIALGYLKRGSPMGELFAREVGAPGPGRVVVAQDLPFIS